MLLLIFSTFVIIGLPALICGSDYGTLYNSAIKFNPENITILNLPEQLHSMWAMYNLLICIIIVVFIVVINILTISLKILYKKHEKLQTIVNKNITYNTITKMNNKSIK